MARVVSEKKPRGRRYGQSGQIVGTRLQPDQLALLDAWREEQPDRPSRPEAIRRIMLQALAKDQPIQ
jgi:hypothetical protein